MGPSGAGAYAGGTIPGDSYDATVEEGITFTNAVVSLHWHATTKARSAPRFEHVSSTAQSADGVSKGDRTLTEKNGWDELDLQIDDL